MPVLVTKPAPSVTAPGDALTMVQEKPLPCVANAGLIVVAAEHTRIALLWIEASSCVGLAISTTGRFHCGRWPAIHAQIADSGWANIVLLPWPVTSTSVSPAGAAAVNWSTVSPASRFANEIATVLPPCPIGRVSDDATVVTTGNAGTDSATAASAAAAAAVASAATEFESAVAELASAVPAAVRAEAAAVCTASTSAAVASSPVAIVMPTRLHHPKRNRPRQRPSRRPIPRR